MPWHRETHVTHNATEQLSWIMRGSNSRRPYWGTFASCQLSSTFSLRHRLFQNTAPLVGQRWHWAIDNRSEMMRCQIQHLCVNFELRPVSNDIHIFYVDFRLSGKEKCIKLIEEHYWKLTVCPHIIPQYNPVSVLPGIYYKWKQHHNNTAPRLVDACALQQKSHQQW